MKIDKSILEVDFDREKLTEALVVFVSSDTLLFFSDKPKLFAKQKELWLPMISLLEKFLDAEIAHTDTLRVPIQSEEFFINLKTKFSILSNKQFLLLYSFAIHTRSVLLALGFLYQKVDAKKAFELSLLEEIWQAEVWGKVWDADDRREETLKNLLALEDFLNE